MESYPLKVNDVVDDCQILCFLGKGKMGWAYKAYDRKNDKIVVIKLMANSPDKDVLVDFKMKQRSHLN